MSASRRVVRQSISLPSPLAIRVRKLAKSKRTTTSKVLVTLVERGMESIHTEKERFFALAARLARTRDVEEQERLKEALAKLTFGV